MILTREQQDVLVAMGVPIAQAADLLEAAQRKATVAARKTLAVQAHALLSDDLDSILSELVMTPSKTSSWVGAALVFEHEGYSVKLQFTDKVATAARKDALAVS